MPGRSRLDSFAKLINPGNDADGMAAALGRLGFKVVLGKDLDTDRFDAKIDEFAAASSGFTRLVRAVRRWGDR